MTTAKKTTPELEWISVIHDRPQSVGNLLILIVVLISIALNIAVIYLLIGNTFSISANNDPLGIKKAILEVEYTKVGGKSNYELLNQAQLIQFTENLPQLKEFIKSQWGQKWGNTGTSDMSSEKITIVPASSITAVTRNGSVIEGNPEAKISVIEYSDMECPFCIKQYHDTKIKEQLFQKYGEGVNFIYKNNRWVNHPGTEPKALGALCAEKVGGAVPYVQFYTAIMDLSLDSRRIFPVSRLPEIAKLIWLDTAKWQSCFDNKETLSVFKSQTDEAISYKLGGTPGTLIKNNRTGKTAIIEWAYPFEAFTEKIDELSK